MSMVAVVTGGLAALLAGGAAVWRQDRVRRQSWEHLRCAIPPNTQVSSERITGSLQEMWAARRGGLIGLLQGPLRLAFEVVSAGDNVETFWSVPPGALRSVRASLQHAYGDTLQVTPVPDPLPSRLPQGTRLAICRLRLKRPSVYSLAEFDRQVLPALTHRMTTLLTKDERAILQVAIQPLADSGPIDHWHIPGLVSWKAAGREDLRRAIGRPDTWSTRLQAWGKDLGLGGASRRHEAPDPHQRLQVRDTPEKLQAHGFAVEIRLIVLGHSARRCLALAKELSAPFHRLDSANRLALQPLWFPSRRWRDVVQRTFEPGNQRVLTPAELASMTYVPAPASNERTARLYAQLPEVQDGVQIGLAEGVSPAEAARQPVQLATKDLRQHLLINGGTGTGKTTFFNALALPLIERGTPVICIDPLGGFAEALLKTIPRQHWDNVLYIEPGNPDWAWPMNLLWAPPRQEEQVVERTVNLFRRIAGESGWGPATEDILAAAAEAAVADHGTLLELRRVITDPAYRHHVIPLLRNQETVAVLREFDQESKGNISQRRNIAAPLNKVRVLLRRRALRLLLCQQDCIDPKAIIEGDSPIKVVILNLNKGRLGQMAARVLGGSFLGMLEQTFLARSAADGDARQAIIICDEMRDLIGTQKTDNEAVDTLLTQVRQKGGGLVMGEQFLKQLGGVMEAVKSNTGTKIALESSLDDAEVLGAMMGVNPQDIARVGNYRGYATAKIGGKRYGPFSFYVPKPPPVVTEDPRELAERSFRRFARPVAEVEAKIRERYTKADEAANLLEVDDPPDDLQELV